MADSATTPAVKNTVELEADVNVEFNEAASRQQINSGESVKTLFGKLRKFLSDLKAVAFTGAYSDLSGTPDLSRYASKAKYGDTTIDVGRKSGTTVGSCSTAEGSNTTASGICSHAESGETTASGDFSHAEGLQTTAAQSYTHAEGYNTSSNAPAAHAEGVSSIAAGQASHAEGQGTQAVGNNSHSGGYGANSFNNSSFSHGIYTIANKDGEIAFGKYNKSNDDTVFSVGDGTSDSARHNAFEITTTGGKLHDKDVAVDVSNPNLLINPDFKINQRGVSGTFSEAGKYFVDRWRLVSGAVTVNADGTLTLNGTISQIFENAVGDNVTASVSAGTATYDNSTKTFSITANGEIISWAKLEYGSNATQFFQPDPATEWLKCMRYYEKISSGADRSFLALITADYHVEADISFKVPKRTPPSLIADQLRVVISIPGSYIVSFRAFKLYQSEIYGVTFATVDPVITEPPSHLFGVSLDGSFAIDAEIY